jgi:hypothetical protein
LVTRDPFPVYPDSSHVTNAGFRRHGPVSEIP